MSLTLQLDVLRHGQSELSHTLRGSTDDALTQLGWQQMQISIEHVQKNVGQCWDAIVSSPLQRCLHFSQELSVQLNVPLLTMSAFQEMHFGDWEGLDTQFIYDHFPNELNEFWLRPTQYSPPNAETIQQFQSRVILGLEMLRQQACEHHWHNVLLVSHGGVIKLMKCMSQSLILDDILKMSAELGQVEQFTFSTHLGLRNMAEADANE